MEYKIMRVDEDNVVRRNGEVIEGYSLYMSPLGARGGKNIVAFVNGEKQGNYLPAEGDVVEPYYNSYDNIDCVLLKASPSDTEGKDYGKYFK